MIGQPKGRSLPVTRTENLMERSLFIITGKQVKNDWWKAAHCRSRSEADHKPGQFLCKEVHAMSFDSRFSEQYSQLMETVSWRIYVSFFHEHFADFISS